MSPGSLIPSNAVYALEKSLSEDSAKSYTEKHENPFGFQQPRYIPSKFSNNTLAGYLQSNERQGFKTPTHITNSNIQAMNNTSAEISSSSITPPESEPMYSNDSVDKVEDSMNLDNLEEKPELLSMPTLVW